MIYECTHCGSAVTASFVRVFGDRDGNVYHCPNCRSADAAAKVEGGGDAGLAGG